MWVLFLIVMENHKLAGIEMLSTFLWIRDCSQLRIPREVFKQFLEISIPYYPWKRKEKKVSCLLIRLKKKKDLNWGIRESRDSFTYHIFLITVWTEVTWYNCSILKQYFIDSLGGNVKCIQLNVSSYTHTSQLNANQATFSYLFQLREAWGSD